MQWIPTVIFGFRYSLNISIKFSGVSYLIICRVLSKTFNDSCIVYLPFVNNSCCWNSFNGFRVSCITFSKLLSAECCVFWSELDCSKSLLVILFIFIRNNAPATTLVVQGFIYYFRGETFSEGVQSFHFYVRVFIWDCER